jgi:hypothetical protein
VIPHTDQPRSTIHDALELFVRLGVELYDLNDNEVL